MILPYSGPNYLQFSSNYAISTQFKVQMASYLSQSTPYIWPSLSDLNLFILLVILHWPQHPVQHILISIFLTIIPCPCVFTHALFIVYNALISFFIFQKPIQSSWNVAFSLELPLISWLERINHSWVFLMCESLLIESKCGSRKPTSPENKHQGGREEHHVTLLRAVGLLHWLWR